MVRVNKIDVRVDTLTSALEKKAGNKSISSKTEKKLVAIARGQLGLSPVTSSVIFTGVGRGDFSKVDANGLSDQFDLDGSLRQREAAVNICNILRDVNNKWIVGEGKEKTPALNKFDKYFGRAKIIAGDVYEPPVWGLKKPT